MAILTIITFFAYLFPIILIGIMLFKIISLYRSYNKSDYKTTNTNGFFKTIRDKGLYGEYVTFTYLEELDIEY